MSGEERGVPEVTASHARKGASTGPPRAAVLHEWFARIGGSEQVSMAMAKALDADLWALWSDSDLDSTDAPRSSVLGHLPARVRSKAVGLALTPAAWRLTRAPSYDLVVTSSHGLGHTAKLRGSASARYLSYVHTPARYVWNPELDGRGSSPWLEPARTAIKTVDRHFSRHVSGYACNSSEVRSRIQEHWGKEAMVIPPPVDTDFYRPVPEHDVSLPNGLNAKHFLLAAGRWVPYKRMSRAVDVAERADLPLVIAGGGPDAETLMARAATARVPVLFVHDPSREELRQLYSAALAVVFPGHEDFGMVPVEAQACGTPVVALDRGGALDSVIDGRSGFLVPDEVAAYGAAIESCASLSASDIRGSALRFSVARFETAIQRWALDAVSS